MGDGTDPLAMTAAEADLWQHEVAYWDLLRAGDMERFLALWHDEVIAWPSNQSAPADKSTVHHLRSDLIARVDLTAADIRIIPRAVRLYGDTGVVYYELHLIPAEPHGTAIHNRMVHTWQRAEDGWRIIGGMSAPLAVQQVK